MLIITNNPEFKPYTNKYDVEFIETDYLHILEKARDYIHKNYKLLTHPLYGSVKPYETLYRTIVIEKSKDFSLSSLELIEDSIATAKKFYEMNKHFKWTDDILEDFKLIDKDLIDNALMRI